MGKRKAQATTEYLLIYISFFAIAIVVAYVLLSMLAQSSSNIVPPTCSFDTGVYCKAIFVVSNFTSTKVALLDTNMMPYAMKDASFNVTLGSESSVATCSPSVVNPGAPMLCVATMPLHSLVGSFASGNIKVGVAYCGISQANCSRAVHEEYTGNFSTNTKSMIAPKVSLIVTPSTGAAKSNQTIRLWTGLNLFGYNFNIANPEIISSNPSISIVSNSITTPSQGGFVSYASSNGTTGTTTITASYAGLDVNVTLAFIPSAYSLLVANFLSDNLTVINTTSAAVSQIGNLETPSDVAVSANQMFAYVTESTLGKVAVVDLSSGNVIGSIGVGSFPTAIAIENGYAYVADSGSGSVSVVSLAGMNVIKTIHTGIFPSYIAASSDGADVFVINQLSENITIINATTKSVAGVIALDSVPYALAPDAAGNVVYVTFPSKGTVEEISVSNGAVMKGGDALSVPFGVAYDQLNNELYVADAGTNSVSIMNATTLGIVRTVYVGFLPTVATISPDYRYVYILDSGSDMISIINTTNDAAAGTYPTGVFPTGMALRQ